MIFPSAGSDRPGPGGPPAALECGTICAVAGQSQRDMRAWAAGYPDLYSAKAFDPALFSTLALAAAFSGPGLTADRLRMANRVCLWCFGLDWLIDYVASSPAEVGDVVRRCEAVADGAPPVPGDDLTRFLADIRDELAAAPAFPVLRTVWRDELQRMLDAMARESEWKLARASGVTARPTFEEYLANADNLGFSFVFATHWIAGSAVPEAEGAATAEKTERAAGGSMEGAGDVRRASWEVQRVIRLLNDLGTYDRDLKWGDLNGLMLDVTRADVDRRITEVTARARELIGGIRAGHPELARYMERQMDFCAGFYGVTDYWGSL